MDKYHHSPDKCTTCTTCTAYCPVSAVTRKFYGPKMTGPAFERFRLLHQTEEEALEYCSNCKNCDISCPQGVPISTFNMMARAEYYKQHRHGINEWFVAHGELMGKLIKPFPKFLVNFGMNNPVTRFFLDILGIHAKAPLPNFAKKTFKQIYRKMDCGQGNEKTIVFYPGCFIDIYVPQIGVDLVEILKLAGYHVIVPREFVCCGVPMVSNGFANDAERNAMQNTNELARWAKAGIPVLAACPSCALMLKQEYHELFPATKKAAVHASAVVDACEFVAELIESGEWKPEFKDDDVKALYHAPCHLRAQGAGKTGLELTRMLPGVIVDDADAGCCGISGSYGFKKDKYRIAMDVGKKLFDTVDMSDAPHVLTECGTCKIWIQHGMNNKNKEVTHPVSYLRSRLK